MIRAASLLLLLVWACQAAGFQDSQPWKRTRLSESDAMITSLALEAPWVAAGLSAGGVSLSDTGLSKVKAIVDPVFGKNGRIHSVAWFRKQLWIASEGGLYSFDPVQGRLDRTRAAVPVAARSGVTLLHPQGADLWWASSRRLGRTGSSQALWNLPVVDEPTSMVVVGGRVLVGTATKGILILDSTSGKWSVVDKGSGLGSDQIAGLEWIGGTVQVATPEGIDALDLSTFQARPVFPGVMASWMTQVHGTLLASTFDGLLQLDAANRDSALLALPEGLQAEGDLRYQGGFLAVACRSELLLRRQGSILGLQPLEPHPGGLRARLPASLAPDVEIQALLRLPEWPDAAVPVEVRMEKERDAVVLALPASTQGRVLIELVARKGTRIQEIRSQQVVAGDFRPKLLLDPYQALTRASEVELGGVVTGGVGGRRLVLLPTGGPIQLDRQGRFRHRVPLGQGDNRLQLEVTDSLGGTARSEVLIRRDDRPPELLPFPVDTVNQAEARLWIGMREPGNVKVVVSPARNAKLTVLDSVVILDVRELAPGSNQWMLRFEDQAGNVSATVVKAFRKVSVQAAAPGGKEEPAPVDVGTSSASMSAMPSGLSNDPSSAAAPARSGSDSSRVFVIRYRVQAGETFRKIAKKFYGKKSLAPILIRWNGFYNPASWPRLPEGALIDVPVWRDLQHGDVFFKDAMESFPWSRYPVAKERRR